MIFDMVVYVTLINLTEMVCGMYSTTKELSISLFMCFRIFNFRQIKMIFRGDGNLKKKFFISNVSVYRYTNLIKTDKYFRTNYCLVIYLKQNRIEIK